MRYKNSEKLQELDISKYSFDEEIIYLDFKKRRTLSIWGEVTESKEYSFNHMLEQLCVPNKDGEKLPITIKISSYGGELEAGLSMMSAIKTAKYSGYPIYTKVYGKAMSIAILPTIVGTKRFCQPHTRFMIHNPLGFSNGYLSAEDYKRTAVEMSDIVERYKNLILANTTIDKKILEDAFDRNSEFIFYGEDAIKYGFIDGIL